jgi:hypothetical protein
VLFHFEGYFILDFIPSLHTSIHTASIVIYDMQLPAILPVTDRMVGLKQEQK